MNTAVDQLTTAMAERLEDEADAIVERWIDWLEEESDNPAVRGLPRRAIRDHIPPVLRSIATYLRAPVQAARAEMLGHLELHANLRRAQGYELDELLTEFEGLCRIVSHVACDSVAGFGRQFEAADVIAAAERLAMGLRAIGFATVQTFRESEIDQRRRLSGHLEEFARTIAHELRAPLHTASLGLQLLRQQNATAGEHDEPIDIVENALSRTADLLDNLRQLAIVESGRSRRAKFGRVQRLVQEALEQIGPIARQRGVDVAIEGDVPDVAVDAVAFQLALVNVVSNAIKYSDSQRDQPRVAISFAQEPVPQDLDLLVATVCDNGLGIAPEYVQQVFQRQLRVHPDAAEGTGLGLSITRQLILERGGEIDLQSEPGVGTTVTFGLPCHPGAISQQSENAHEPESLADLAVEQATRDGERSPE